MFQLGSWTSSSCDLEDVSLLNQKAPSVLIITGSKSQTASPSPPGASASGTLQTETLPAPPPQPQGGVAGEAARLQRLLLVLVATPRPCADDVIVWEPAPPVGASRGGDQ